MIFFFIREYNDVDHTVPIIYKIAETSQEKIMVISLNWAYPIKQDYRLQFLAKKFGIETEYVYEVFAPTWLHKVVASLLCGTREREEDESLTHYILRLFYCKYLNPRLFDSVIRRFVYSRRWAEMFLEKFKPSVMVFDWIKPFQLVTGHLMRTAQALKIPTVAVPPGIPMYMDELFSNTLVERGKPIPYGELYGLFTHFVVQFSHLKKVATSSGLAPEKVNVLGSARFCDEWRQIHRELVSHIHEDYGLDGVGKLKVVFMDSLAIYRIDVEVVVNSLRRLSKLDGLQLLIKPHTRGNRLSVMELGKAAQVVDKVPSGVLCDWADVIMGTSSSVLLEAFRLNKVLLYPKFFHENTMLFEEYGACWKVENYEELETALRKLMGAPSYRPYSDRQVNRLLTEVVKGGEEKRDVLKGYSDFILRLANGEQKHASKPCV